MRDLGGDLHLFGFSQAKAEKNSKGLKIRVK